MAASRTTSRLQGHSVFAVPLPDLAAPFYWTPLLRNCDAVVHLAGTAHRFAEEDLYDRVNQAAEELARAALRSSSHLVLISSIAAQSLILRSRID